jgi:hypothetical protein
VQPRSPAPASPGGQQAIAYLVFALIGTLGLGVPVVLDIATLTPAQLLAMLVSGGTDGIQFDGDPGPWPPSPPSPNTPSQPSPSSPREEFDCG